MRFGERPDHAGGVRIRRARLGPSSRRHCQALNIPIDGIICNAGIMALPKLTQAHGYELQFFTNHVGHFLR